VNDTVINVPALSSLPLFVLLAENDAIYNVVKLVHLIGVCLLVGPVVAFDLRVLGAAASVPIAALARLLLPLAAAALVLIIPTGVIMFGTLSDSLLGSQVFAIKMALVLAGGIVAVIFHTGPYSTVESWREGGTPVSARACAVLSISGWVATVGCAVYLVPR
jgi:hypothetical protein